MKLPRPAYADLPLATKLRQLENVPAELGQQKAWLLWTYLWKGAKWTKPPHYANGKTRNGANNHKADRRQLVTLPEAIAALKSSGRKFVGVGFAPHPDCGFVFLDLDHSLDEIGLPITDAARALLPLDTYTEVSPSGSGLRMVLRGEVERKWASKELEVFGGIGYVTMTGHTYGPAQHIRQATPDTINVLRERTHAPPPRVGTDTGDTIPNPLDDRNYMLAKAALLPDDREPWIDPDIEYDDWLAIGMALHSGDHTPDGRGFELWRDWSAKGAKYVGEEDLLDHWQTFFAGKGRTLATLFAMAQANGYVQSPKAATAAWKLPGPISLHDYYAAVPTPGCIVADYLYRDVALLIAAGGIGKTTLILYEAVHIALGMPLYGKEIVAPGPVVILTAEDPYAVLVARLRCIVEAMNLGKDQVDTVLRAVRIWDVSGHPCKLTVVENHAVVLSPLLETLIDECRQLQPVLVVLDPAISFGVGEMRVNDAEQGLVEAARRVRNELRCCVRYVHHSGKQNARDATADQYTSRGGSALPDGSRMVAVLQPMDALKWANTTSTVLADGDQAMMLSLPKLSYTKPQPEVLIRRRAFAFECFRKQAPDPAATLETNCEQVLRMVAAAIARGEKPTQNSLEATGEMQRASLRAAIATLRSRNRLRDVSTPSKGGPQKHLAIVGQP